MKPARELPSVEGKVKKSAQADFGKTIDARHPESPKLSRKKKKEKTKEEKKKKLS